MRFSLGLIALGASIVHALLPPEVLISELHSLTESLELLIEPAEEITIQNAQQMVIKSGPLHHVLDGIRGVISHGLRLCGDFELCNEGPEFVYTTEGDAILEAFVQFTTAARDFVTTMYNKRKLLQVVPLVGPPIFTNLRGLDTIVWIILEDLIGAMMPEISHKAVHGFWELEKTLGRAMEAYNTLGDEPESKKESEVQRGKQREEQRLSMQQYL